MSTPISQIKRDPSATSAEDTKLIEDIIAQVEESPLDMPAVPAPMPTVAPMTSMGMGSLPPMGMHLSAPAPAPAPSAWSSLALQDWQTWKTVLLLAVLVFLLHSQQAQNLVSGYLSDSWPLRAHLPTLLLSLVGGLAILVLFRFHLIH